MAACWPITSFLVTDWPLQLARVETYAKHVANHSGIVYVAMETGFLREADRPLEGNPVFGEVALTGLLKILQGNCFEGLDFLFGDDLAKRFANFCGRNSTKKLLHDSVLSLSINIDPITIK